MEEIIFLVEESDEGGYIARALGVGIVTEAANLDELHTSVKDAIDCHYDDRMIKPKKILYY